MSYMQDVIEDFNYLFSLTATDVKPRAIITGYFRRIKDLEKEIADDPTCEKANRLAINELRSEIVTSNVRLIAKLAMKMGLDPAHASKWHSAGCVGLVKALNTFNVDFTVNDKPVAFTTYACRCIQIELLHELEHHGGMWSTNMTKKIWATTKALEFLARNGIVNPTDEELLDAVRKCWEIRRQKEGKDIKSTSRHVVPLITTKQDMQVCRRAQAVVQVDMFGKTSSKSGRDGIWEPSAEHSYDLDDVDNKELVQIILDSVDDRTREMMELHFGLIPGKDPVLQKEICQIYGVTKQRVSQIFKEVGKSVRANFSSPYESSVCRQTKKFPKHGSSSSAADPVLRV